ncbi:MAG: hypothetical protein DI539_24465 [Flavobacterium psychrophilum]|nr:MAG: hypothetical protein DI539_24465 [Flavobacterium psychrophilum]
MLYFLVLIPNLHISLFALQFQTYISLSFLKFAKQLKIVWKFPLNYDAPKFPFDYDVQKISVVHQGAQAVHNVAKNIRYRN